MTRQFGWLFAIGLLWLLSDLAFALPRFSLQKGEGCATCHVNPSGQGLRNRYGREVFGPNELAAKKQSALKAEIAKRITIGGDIRSQGFVYVDDGEDATETSLGAFAMQADLYLNVAINDKMSVYVEQDALRGTAEAFGTWAPKGHERYVKFGVFLPNYGLRIDDHTAFIRGGNPRTQRLGARDGLFWGPNYADTGVEAGIELLDVEWTLGAYNGGPIAILANEDTDLAYLVRAETYAKIGKLRSNLGANLYTTRNADLDDRMFLAGGFVGIGGEIWTLMGEVDLAKNYLETIAEIDPGADPVGATSLAAFVEGTFRLTQGFHFVERFEYFDPDLDVAEGRYWRVAAGAEWYPVPYLELKPTVRYTDQPKGMPKLLEALLQAHWWF